MSDHILWPIIGKYLSGECSPEEMLFMETWLEQEENHLLFQQLENAWRNQQVSDDSNMFDVNRGLNLLYSKIEENESKSIPSPRLTIGVNTWFAAASILLILGMAFNFYKNKTRLRETSEIALIQTVTGNRDMFKILLPDSSVVWLNKKSMLEYPASFEGKERIVNLKGNAFFEVTPNKDKPFIINSNGMSTKVLGTSFEIKAYPGQKENEVAVVTGKVEVSTDNDKERTTNKILPGQKLTANLENTKTYIDNVSLKSIAHWRLDPLVFRDNTYREVADQLEMRFEKKIIFKNEGLKKCRVMASFNRDATLRDILKLLSISNSFEFVIGSKTVTVSGGICN